MIAQAVRHKIAAFLEKKARSRGFPALFGVCALFATVTLTLPVEFLVVVGVLVSPARWLRVSLWAALGSSLGTAGLYFAFHHLGWNLLVAWYPDLVTSQLWADTMRWPSRFFF